MRRLAASIAAALLIASAGAALGEDTINGKPLSDVHDIIREVNGDDTFVPKTQILKLKQVGNDLRGDLWTAPYDQGRSGSHSVKPDVMKPGFINDKDHYMGIQAAVSTKPVEGGKRRVVVGDLYYAGGGGIKTFLTEPTGDGSFKISGAVRDLPVVLAGPGSHKFVFTDMRGGLFIDGESEESFVAGFMNDKDRDKTFSGGNNGGKNASVGVLILDGRKLNAEGFKGDPTGGLGVIDQLDSDSQFPVARIVAGDFDGDGIASEIAWIATPKEDPYRVRVYKVYRIPGGAIKTAPMLQGSYDSIDTGLLHGGQRDSECGCDIVAGDFDGDGRTELATVAVTAIEMALTPLVRTFKYVDGGWKMKFVNFGTKYVPNFKDTDVPGIIAAAGDFDGNGKDEVAFVAALKNAEIYLAMIEFEDNPSGAPTPVLKAPGFKYKVKHEQKWTPLASVASLAAGPTYAAAGDSAFYDELYMTLLGSDDKTRLYHLTDPLGAFDAKELRSETSEKVTALVASDIAGESMALGKPDHIITGNARSFYTLLPAVPYHIDYIRSDWRDMDPDGPAAPRALQFITPQTSVVKYSRAMYESKQNDTSFETHSHFELGSGIGASVKKGFKAVGINGGIEGSFQHAKDNIDNIEKKLSSETTSTSSQVDTKAQDHDVVHYYRGTLHTWRYPITGTVADANKMFSDDPRIGIDVPQNDPLKNVPIEPEMPRYYTVMRITDVRPGHSGAEPGDRYQPDYDESNLFSYPNGLSLTKAYKTRQKDLSPTQEYTSDETTDQTIRFESIRSETNSEVKTKNNGGSVNVTGGIAVPPGKLAVFTGHVDGSVGGNYTVSNGTTFTSTSKSTTSYTVSIEEDFNSPESLFGIEHAAYIDAGGMTTLGFAVDLRPKRYDIAHAWDDYGAYSVASDPSLVLPGRVFVATEKQNGKVVKFPKPQTDMLAATRLRGVRLYDLTAGEDPEVGTSYTVSTLIRGREYTIVVPVYNASFVNTGDFEVEFGYTTHDHLKSLKRTKSVPAADDVDVKQLGKTKMKLRSWVSGSDSHRGAAEYTWTVPTDLPQGSYELCVHILGRSDDIHRDWNLVEGSSEYDPCGNDWGHFQFSVVDEADLTELQKKFIHPASASDLSAAASTSEPKIDVTFTVEGQEPMTFDQFRSWLLGRTDPVDVDIEVANTGDEPILEAFAVVYEQLEDGRERTLFDGDLSSLFPGKSISRRFTIDPQKFVTRDLRAEISASDIELTFGEPAAGGSSSSGGSGGCAAGAAGMAAIALLFAATRRRS